MSTRYAGIGSRQLTEEQIGIAVHVGMQLHTMGWHLISGGADGADSAFASNHPQGTRTIWVPWKGFNKVPDGQVIDASYNSLARLAQDHHRNWASLSNAAKLLMMRNVQIMLSEPNLVVYCQDPEKDVNWPFGGTNHALRVARSLNIPTFNIASEEGQAGLDKWVNENA